MIISKTPLRCSIVGGGTDFEDFYKIHGGCVVSFAIDKYVYVIIKERYDDLIVLNYTQHEIVEKVDDIKHDLIRACLQFYGIDKGIEITTLADIPSKGCGLGSSSAITVGLLNALSGYVGYPQELQTLAGIACDIEIVDLKSPIGRQDQYACTYGGMNTITFDSKGINCHAFGRDYYNIADNLFLHFTGQTRQANTILSKQKKNISKNTKSLLKLKALAEGVDEAIALGRYDYIGKAIRLNWELKRGLSEGVSNKEVDEMIEKAYSGGAMGCKLTGAGGGGFLLSYVPADKHQVFKTKMSEYRELPFKIDPYGTRIIFNIS